MSTYLLLKYVRPGPMQLRLLDTYAPNHTKIDPLACLLQSRETGKEDL